MKRQKLSAESSWIWTKSVTTEPVCVAKLHMWSTSFGEKHFAGRDCRMLWAAGYLKHKGRWYPEKLQYESAQCGWEAGRISYIKFWCSIRHGLFVQVKYSWIAIKLQLAHIGALHLIWSIIFGYIDMISYIATCIQHAPWPALEAMPEEFYPVDLTPELETQALLDPRATCVQLMEFHGKVYFFHKAILGCVHKHPGIAKPPQKGWRQVIAAMIVHFLAVSLANRPNWYRQRI